jgi:tetratricopeptide (TPR) repeat protein
LDARSASAYLRHLARPARGGALLLIIAETVGLELAAKAGLFGLPLSLLLLSYFFKYAFVLFDYSSRGFDEPPVLSLEMVNPANEQRPVVVLVILILCSGALWFVRQRFGSAIATLLGGIVLAVLPALIAVLGVESHAFKAVHPPLVLAMIRGLGPAYLLVIGAALVWALILEVAALLGVWSMFANALAMLAVLSIFSVLGGAVYERRFELGAEAWVSPERDAARAHQAQRQADQREIDEAWAKSRAGDHARAFEMLQQWLAAKSQDPAQYEWLLAHLASWHEPRFALRIAQEYLERLLALARPGEALSALERQLRINPQFRPKSSASTLTLARIAAQGGAPRTAKRLLADFAQHFPEDVAGAQQARLLTAQLDS